MIKNNTPLSMAESTEYLEKDSNAMIFIKKFSTLSAKDAKEMRKKLENLQLIKVDDTHISKIIDLIPEKSEEINKIFIDVGLDENETKKILDVVKEFI
jgi:DNA-directed RNA polymerase subunit F